ncbi:MAG: hypothetical protein PSN34_06480 [Urechidicola sp.]|nr:hypothetical protein [Urechidicola sp.]
MQTETRKKIKTEYFHGIGSLIAKKLNVSEKYVRDVLNGLHDERDTQLVKDIKSEADKYVPKAS